MTLQGTVLNGVIVLENKQVLAEGTRVTVTVTAEQKQAETLRDVLMNAAGCMENLPPDLAAQHDHYLHGTAKR